MIHHTGSCEGWRTFSVLLKRGQLVILKESGSDDTSVGYVVGNSSGNCLSTLMVLSSFERSYSNNRFPRKAMFGTISQHYSSAGGTRPWIGKIALPGGTVGHIHPQVSACYKLAGNSCLCVIRKKLLIPKGRDKCWKKVSVVLSMGITHIHADILYQLWLQKWVSSSFKM